MNYEKFPLTLLGYTHLVVVLIVLGTVLVLVFRGLYFLRASAKIALY